MTFDTVKEIITSNLNVDPSFITMDTNFLKDLNADSLDAVEIVLALEEHYNIEIPDEEAEKFETVKDIVEFIERTK